MIPQESTPIKHTILIEIIAQGRLSYDEVRIACFIMRWSWGFDEGERRQDWTKEFTISEIAKEIKIKRGWCSTTINRMLKDGKLLKDGNKYQFNEHYENWKTVRKTDTVRNTDTYRQENLHPLSEKLTPTVSNTDTPDVQESLIAKAPESKNPLRKDTLKILKDKDTLKISAVEAYPKIIFNNQTFKFENIPKEKIEKWKEAFLNCNVDLELKKMEAWLMANPKNKKVNYERFIVNWFSRAMGRAVPKKEPERIERTGFYDLSGRRID